MSLHVFHTGMRPFEARVGDLFRDPNTGEVWEFSGVLRSFDKAPGFRCYLHKTKRCAECLHAANLCYPAGAAGLHISHKRMRHVDAHVLVLWERVRRFRASNVA